MASETPAKLLRTQGTGGVAIITKCVVLSYSRGLARRNLTFAILTYWLTPTRVLQQQHSIAMINQTKLCIMSFKMPLCT